jgi:hypothetical protein
MPIRIQGFDDQKWKKFTAEKKIKLQKKTSALKTGHPALQNKKFLIFLLFWVIFALLDPDSKSRSGSTDLIEPDPIRIRNTEKKMKNYLALCSIKLGEGLEP